jgi:hypothetical protein
MMVRVDVFSFPMLAFVLTMSQASPPPFKYIFRWRRVTSPLWMVLIYTLPRNSDEISLALRNGVLTWWDSRVCWHCRRRSKSHVNEETQTGKKSFFFFPPHFLPYKALGWRNSFSLSTCPPLCPQGSCLTAFLNQPNQPASLFLVGRDTIHPFYPYKNK